MIKAFTLREFPLILQIIIDQNLLNRNRTFLEDVKVLGCKKFLRITTGFFTFA